MRASQTGASALLGFLSSLQQGTEQRNAQREQILQQKAQQMETDRAFGLQKGAFDLQQEEANRQRQKEKLNEPLEALTRKQALGAPDVQAQQGWNAANAKSDEIRRAASQLRIQAATKRNPIEKQALLQEADTMERQASAMLSREQSLIGLTPGVTVKPWESAAVTQGASQVQTGIGSTQSPVTGVTNGSAPAVSTSTGTTATSATQGAAVQPVGGVTQQPDLGPFGFLLQKQANPQSLPLTSAEMELFDKAAKGVNLGSLLGADYYQRPEIGYETGPVGPRGQYYGTKSFIRAPKSYDPDYQRFIGDNAQSFIEMLNEVGYVADQNYISRDQAFESLLGKDRTLWPIEKSADGTWTPKSNWWGNLTSDQKTRFTSRVSKYIAPSEQTALAAKDMRTSVTEALVTKLEQDKSERERRWKLYDDQVEAANKKDIASISNVNNKDPNAAATLDAQRTDKMNAYEGAKGNIETFTKLGNAGTEKKEMAAELLGVDPTTLEGIELSVVASMYASAARIAQSKLNNVNILRYPDLATQLTEQTRRYGLVTENALREAGQTALDKLNARATNTPEASAAKRRTIDWIKNRTGITTTVTGG